MRREVFTPPNHSELGKIFLLGGCGNNHGVIDEGGGMVFPQIVKKDFCFWTEIIME